MAVFYLKYSYGRISLSCKKNEDLNILLTLRCTSTAFQEELRAILPVNPASVNFALFSPRGIGIGLDMSSTGGRQTRAKNWRSHGRQWRVKTDQGHQEITVKRPMCDNATEFRKVAILKM